MNNLICKNSNYDKAITLISLVITIIILLILSGITIATLNGENGLFARAKEAKENTIEAQEKENATLSDYNSRIDKVLNSNSGDSSNNNENNENSGGNSTIGESKVIKEIKIEGIVKGRSIDLTLNSILNNGYTNEDISTYIYVLNGEVKEIKKDEKLSISKLEANTKYSIYVIAVDKYAGMIKSNNIEQTTDAADIIPLEYPILTENGIVNTKIEYVDRIEYELNLNYECTNTQAIGNLGYDGDVNTQAIVYNTVDEGYIYVDESAYNKTVEIKNIKNCVMHAKNASGTVLARAGTDGESKLTIPPDTKYLFFTTNAKRLGNLYLGEILIIK